MDKYIDVEIAIKDIKGNYCKPCKRSGDDYRGIKCRACWVGDCISIIDDCEEADVQPVVHCKDCIYYDKKIHCCTYLGNEEFNENEYCSKGDKNK